MSTVLGPAIEFAFTAGYVVAARSAAVPGVEDLVLMAASGARRVDVVDGLIQPRRALARDLPTATDAAKPIAPVTARSVQIIVGVIKVGPSPNHQ